MLWLIKDMFLVWFLTKKVLHAVLLDVACNFHLTTKPGKRICVGDEFDAPFVDTEKEKPSVEAIKVFCGDEIDVGKGVGRKKKFTLYIWIKYQGVGVIPSASLNVGVIPQQRHVSEDLYNPFCPLLSWPL